jgi:phosphoglycolate phosphatase-like HAD superfamily hydrolase
VIPPRERLLQLARLAGVEAFRERFGPPQAAHPGEAELRAFVGARLDEIARRLVEEAAASDDVIDRASAAAYLEDRLGTLGDLFSKEQAARVRTRFGEETAGW